MLLPRKLLGLIYLAIGVFVAVSRDYFENLDTVKRVLSAILAILLWPCCSSESTCTSNSAK